MKDKKDEKHPPGNKIVLFPNVHERLVEKGLEELGQKNFVEAVQLFTQAREFDTKNAEVNVGLLVSLVELQQYESALSLCQELLNQGIGDYFQVMSIYLMVLLQPGKHEEMVQTIELLFQENQIPFDKIDQFEKMLRFGKKVLKEKRKRAERNQEQWPTSNGQEGVFHQKNDHELMELITKFSTINIRPFMEDIQSFLRQENNHPFFKTLLLITLKEQEYTQSITVTKYGKTLSIIPSQLADVKEQECFNNARMLLEQILSQQDPSLLDMIYSLLERHEFLLYPFGLEYDAPTLAAAYHSLAEQYMTGQEVEEMVTAIYETDAEKVKGCISYLKEIEGISYPII